MVELHSQKKVWPKDKKLKNKPAQGYLKNKMSKRQKEVEGQQIGIKYLHNRWKRFKI